jgi:hypothetical protein
MRFAVPSYQKSKQTQDRHQFPQLADIIRLYKSAYLQRHNISQQQRKVVFNIEHCRTEELGYHVDQCPHCQYSEYSYNSCHDRHCPKCQGIARRRWVKARLKDLLPIPYYHVVFTLPHFLFPLTLYNKDFFYNLLLDCASATLLQFGRDPKHLGGLIGFFGILHTWGGKMWQHLHGHFVVGGGAISADGRWLEPKYKSKFLFPVCALSQVFRGKFIEGLKTAWTNGELTIPSDMEELKDPAGFERWIDTLAGRNWVVFSKPPFASPAKVVEYLGRYSHRIAISNNRILSLEDSKVTFSYKDYKNKGRWDTTCLEAEEFIRRFLMHVVPSGFHRIRHYGFLANGKCKSKIKQIKEFLVQHQAEQLDKEVQEANNANLNDNGIICPACGQGYLRAIMVVTRFGTRIIKQLMVNREPYFNSS